MSEHLKLLAAGIDAAKRKPRHRQVFETVLRDIQSGRFQPGDRLPTEAELAKNFDASRSTVARAMRDLKSNGHLSRRRGGGTHITKLDEKRIALFTPFTQSPADLGYIGGQIYAHLSELAAHRGDHLRLQIVGKAAGGDKLEQMMAATQALIQQGVAGIFYYPVELPKAESHYNQLVVDVIQAAGIAVVAVDRDVVAFPHRSAIPLVAYDNRRGGYLITDHLIEQGCRRIAFIGSPFVSSAAADRKRGYCDALADHGLKSVKSLVKAAALDELDAAFCRDLYEQGKPDAILCKMDLYAAPIGRHLVDMGLTIGTDVLLAGFDDEPIAGLLPVPLTTVRFPSEPFAQVCYEQMTSRLAKPDETPSVMTLIDVELVIRESTSRSDLTVRRSFTN